MWQRGCNTRWRAPSSHPAPYWTDEGYRTREGSETLAALVEEERRTARRSARCSRLVASANVNIELRGRGPRFSSVSSRLQRRRNPEPESNYDSSADIRVSFRSDSRSHLCACGTRIKSAPVVRAALCGVALSDHLIGERIDAPRCHRDLEHKPRAHRHRLHPVVRHAARRASHQHQRRERDDVADYRPHSRPALLLRGSGVRLITDERRIGGSHFRRSHGHESATGADAADQSDQRGECDDLDAVGGQRSGRQPADLQRHRAARDIECECRLGAHHRHVDLHERRHLHGDRHRFRRRPYEQ